MISDPAQSETAPSVATPMPRALQIGTLVVLLTLVVVWTYWSTIVRLVSDWQSDPNYSVGQLVPFAALYLVWTDRERLRKHERSTCWWGLIIVALAQGARFFGLLFIFESAERYSMVLSITGLVLLLGGWRIFWATRWIQVFLFLMVPLPGRIHNAISGPLQDLATRGAVFALELLGITVSAQGNVLVLNDEVSVAVAEACSGLRMLTAFVVVAFVFAYTVRRPKWQKVTLVGSSVLIAVACNLVRLVATAFLFLEVNGDFAKRFFHDFAGWTMMPLAIGMLAAELWIMSRLVEPNQPEPT